MKKLNNFLPFAILLALISLAALAVYKSNIKQNIGKPELSDELEPNKIKLSEFQIPDLFDEKQTFSLADLKNSDKRYSLINFFASWCTTCLAEHDVLLKLKDEKSVDFYGVAWQDLGENTRKFLDKNGNPFHRTAIDSKGVFSQIIGIKAVPETILVDSEGQVILRHEGNLDEETLMKILQFVRQ